MYERNMVSWQSSHTLDGIKKHQIISYTIHNNGVREEATPHLRPS